MAYKIYTQPTEEPIDLDEAKKHLRIEADVTDEDILINAMIVAARRHCESFLGRALITQTWDLYLDAFPDTNYLEIQLPPLQSVTTLKYKDTAGTLQTWAATNYIVDTINEPGRICLAYGISWPTTYGEVQDVQIRFVCGYGLAASVPQQIKSAILLKLTDLYENRGDTESEFMRGSTIERSIESLLWSERIVPI